MNTSHHIHSEIAEQRVQELRGAARSGSGSRRPSAWPDLAPALSVIAGVAGLLVIAAPSL